MAEQLKNILHFSLPDGGSQALPHGLNIQNGRGVIPDHLEPSTCGFTFVADETNVTATGVGDVDVLVEYWHTIERAFGASGVTELDPHPFIPGCGEGGGIPTPPFDLHTTIIYARPTGSDTTGNGETPETAYLTLQRAVRDVPNIIPPGQNYIVDITGVDETLPSNYSLPVWKAPVDFGNESGDPFFKVIGAAVAIQATPQLVQSIPAGDAVINSGDVASTSQDPLTQFWTITLTTPRASWGTSSPGVVGSGLKGKFAVGPSNAVRTHPIVGENTPSTILVTTPDAPTYPIQLMEPGAHLHAGGSDLTFSTLVALNADSISFNGLKITSDDGNGGLFVGGMGGLNIQLCELESPIIESVNDYQVKVLTNWFYGFPSFQSNAFQVNSAVFDNTNNGPFFVFGPPVFQPSFTYSVFDNADPINVGVFVPFHGVEPASASLLAVANCLIRGSTGPGISWHGGNGYIQDCDIYGCGGSAIEADLGHGVLQVLNCGSSGGANGGGADAAVFVNDGANVKVDDDTVNGGSGLTPLQGGAPGQDMQVGSGAAYRTWVNFGTGADGRPVGNEFDFVSATSGVGGTFSDATPAPTYVSGTGSRLYKDAAP